MEKLITVGIPTYNRASLLDNQLSWFAEAVKGNEDRCELIVTDNCSTDDTPRVVDRWRLILQKRGLQMHCNRNSENIGAIRNIAYTIDQAHGKFVWTVSDDDGVGGGTLRYLLNTVETHPELCLLIFNFSSRHWRSRKLKYARCFQVAEDRVQEPGKALFEEIFRQVQPSRWGGLMLTTALVYRASAAKAALREWKEGLNNLSWQLYVTAYSALQGKTILTRDPFLEMAGGRHFFTTDRQMLLRFKLAETPEAFVKLAELGYSRALCEQKIVNQRGELNARLLLQNLSRGPLETVRVLRRYKRAVDHIQKGSFARVANESSPLVSTFAARIR